METEVIVRGEGEARVMPDRAVIHVVVDGDGGSREDAYGATAPLAARVDEVVAAAGPAVDRVVTAALVVHPKTRWRRGESVRTGWRASRTSIVEIVDFTRLGDLLGELTQAGGAVSGPYWSLDATNEVHAEVRRLAAEDARRRAEVYAAALGLAITGIVWVAEPGLRKPGGDGDRPMMRGAFAAAAPMAAGAEAQDTIEVNPEEMTVQAAVEVGFSFAPVSS